ncbi:MAG: GNAT family N-acetyltransferase [Candidatus Babeliaceae bacterium]|nr:GNAT family N-acetyltransferase [Candidatus Babeliaceae bacterium]
MSPLLVDFPMPIKTPRLFMRQLTIGDGYKLNEAVVETVDSLEQWVHWVRRDSLPSVIESEETARRFHADFILGSRVTCGLFVGDNLVGVVGFVAFDWNIPSAEIGYWCRSTTQGNGYITEAVNALTRYAFDVIGIKRLLIICDSENSKSAAVAERLGYKLELEALGIINKPGHPELRLGRQYVRFDTHGLPELSVTW